MSATPNKALRVQILVATGFSVPLVTLFAATLLTYSSSQALWEAFQWVPFSQRVEDSLGDLLATVEDAEVGQRGFLLTGEEACLAPYQNARAVIPKQLECVRVLTTGDAAHEGHLARLEPLIEKRLRLGERTIALKREGKTAEAVQILLGDNSMPEISGIIQRMRTSESGVRLARELEAGRKARGTERYLLWLMAIDVLVISIVILLLVNFRRLEKYVTMCAWSKTVLYDNKWVPFDEYLRRTYDVRVSHGISESERDKFIANAGLPAAKPVQPAAAQA